MRETAPHTSSELPAAIRKEDHHTSGPAHILAVCVSWIDPKTPLVSEVHVPLQLLAVQLRGAEKADRNGIREHFKSVQTFAQLEETELKAVQNWMRSVRVDGKKVHLVLLYARPIMPQASMVRRLVQRALLGRTIMEKSAANYLLVYRVSESRLLEAKEGKMKKKVKHVDQPENFAGDFGPNFDLAVPSQPARTEYLEHPTKVPPPPGSVPVSRWPPEAAELSIHRQPNQTRRPIAFYEPYPETYQFSHVGTHPTSTSLPQQSNYQPWHLPAHNTLNQYDNRRRSRSQGRLDDDVNESRPDYYQVELERLEREKHDLKLRDNWEREEERIKADMEFKRLRDEAKRETEEAEREEHKKRTAIEYELKKREEEFHKAKAVEKALMEKGEGKDTGYSSITPSTAALQASTPRPFRFANYEQRPMPETVASSGSVPVFREGGRPKKAADPFTLDHEVKTGVRSRSKATYPDRARSPSIYGSASDIESIAETSDVSFSEGASDTDDEAVANAWLERFTGPGVESQERSVSCHTDHVVNKTDSLQNRALPQTNGTFEQHDDVASPGDGEQSVAQSNRVEGNDDPWVFEVGE